MPNSVVLTIDVRVRMRIWASDPQPARNNCRALISCLCTYVLADRGRVVCIPNSGGRKHHRLGVPGA